MKAAFLEEIGRITIRDVGAPAIHNATDVLIRVRTVGICGSEVHAFAGTHPFRKAPVILGHEVAGDVIAVGDEAKGFSVGDRVTVDPQWVCGECEYCQAGLPNLCPTKHVLGTQSWPGAFGELIVAPESAVFHLPDCLSYVEGSLIEPLSIAVHVVERASLRKGESVAVLGTGSIGGLVAGVCHARGADPIIVADLHKHCVDTATTRLGATNSFLMPDETLAESALELTAGRGVDVVFITGDDASLFSRALEMGARRGRIVLVALLTIEDLRLPAFELIRKEACVLGSTMATLDDVRESLKLASSGDVDVSAIATHILPIDEAQRGMELARTKADGAIKVILTFDKSNSI